MDPFPPVVEATRCDTLATVASVFPDFGRQRVLEPAAGAGGTDAVADARGAIAEREALRRADYDEGFAAGRADAERELSDTASAFATALDEVGRFRAGLLDRYQQELLELAVGIARKVVQRELAEHPEHWLGMIREAVRHALDREKIHIRMGGVLHRYVVEHLPSLRGMLEEVKELDLVEDATLADNGCVIETHTGDLDLSIDSQIGAIRAALSQAE